MVPTSMDARLSAAAVMADDAYGCTALMKLQWPNECLKIEFHQNRENIVITESRSCPEAEGSVPPSFSRLLGRFVASRQWP